MVEFSALLWKLCPVYCFWERPGATKQLQIVAVKEAFINGIPWRSTKNGPALSPWMAMKLSSANTGHSSCPVWSTVTYTTFPRCFNLDFWGRFETLTGWFNCQLPHLPMPDGQLDWPVRLTTGAVLQDEKQWKRSTCYGPYEPWHAHVLIHYIMNVSSYGFFKIWSVLSLFLTLCTFHWCIGRQNFKLHYESFPVPGYCIRTCSNHSYQSDSGWFCQSTTSSIKRFMVNMSRCVWLLLG